MPTLYTIGYGNRKPEEFFALIPNGATIIDVRRSARGWSSEYSAKRMGERMGNLYLYWPALGNSFHGSHNQWIPEGGWGLANDFLEALASLARTLEQQGQPPIVLLCAESDPQRCHRRFVAEEVAKRVDGLEIVHLGTEGTHTWEKRGKRTCCLCNGYGYTEGLIGSHACDHCVAGFCDCGGE